MKNAIESSSSNKIRGSSDNKNDKTKATRLLMRNFRRPAKPLHQKIVLNFIYKLIATGSSASEILKILDKNDLISMMPEMSKALRILAVIPATSASAE